MQIIEEARHAGIMALSSDETTFQTDDQDCYPHGIVLELEYDKALRSVLMAISKEVEWFGYNYETRTIWIEPEIKIEFRLAELGYKRAISDVFNSHGIKSYVDVHWR